MKYRLSIAVMAVPLVLAAMTWFVAREQGTTIRIVTTAVPLAAVSNSAPPPAVLATVVPPQPPVTVTVMPAIPDEELASAPRLQRPAVNALSADVDGTTRHVARSGETLNSLANDLLGENTRTNRDALIDANTGLQADPDRLVAGQTYFIPPTPEKVPATSIESSAAAAKTARTISAPALANVPSKSDQAASAKSSTELRYVAATGDTVSNMAGAFLGSDGKTQKDAIINANASLQANPDRVVAGKAYHIPAPDGLSVSADPASSKKASTTRPTAQPDADDLVLAGSTRVLRYTARPGDTLTSMAIALLGLDTPEGRNAILINNAILKRDPDRVITGHTYWIPAPTAPTAPVVAEAAHKP